MRAHARTPVLVAALCVVAARHAHATVMEQVPIGPRAIGMGSAFTSIADDASALFWNPAGLARVGHQELSATHANLFGTNVADNLGSFVLPLSPDLAAGLDWYHTGQNDGALGFSENRVTFGWALKVEPWLWVGASEKLLTQGTDLDGSNAYSARGFGTDFGLLAAPADHWHVGLVAQDLTNTHIVTTDGRSVLAYPHNVRAGASYAWSRYGTAAFDVDDRWHLGLEATPHSALALRFGVEDDRRGPEPPTWSYGLGLKAGLLRVDWARVNPPTLDATDHFAVAMEFNFNPAQVRLEKVQAHELYTSLYKSYAREPFGSVTVRNLQDRPLSTRLSVYVPELMSAPSEQEIVLRPKAAQDFPLTAVLDEKSLSQRGDQPVQVQVGASYQSKRIVRRERASARTVAYAPGAIDWSLGMAQAAAYVTPRDPAVDELARQAARLVQQQPGNAYGSRNVAYAAAMTDALAQLGVAYVPDPNNPFATISETPHAVDTVHYPYQTLDRLSGDCDDTTVLMASLLGNVGVDTRFVDAPGHIFLIVDSGLHERNRLALGVDSSMVVVVDEEVWIPLETTALAKGFAEAWRVGAEEIATGTSRGTVGYVDVNDSQERYEPVLPPGERRIRTLDEGRFAERLAAEASALTTRRESWYASRFGAAERELETSATALIEVARVDFEGGDLAGARDQLEAALRKAPGSVSARNDLGVVLVALDSLPSAEEQWRTALALGARDPGVELNLGLSRWARGDSTGAWEAIARAVSSTGGYEPACRLMGLSPQDSLDRAADAAGGEPTLRNGLRAALRRAPGAVRAGQAQGVKAVRAPPAGAPASQLSAAKRSLSKYLYWSD